MINFRLQYEGTLKYLGRVSWALKLGYERYVMDCAWWVWEQVGDTSGCAGELAQLYCTCAKVFHAQMQKQTKVMSFDDVTDISLTYIGGYKSKHA